MVVDEISSNSIEIFLLSELDCYELSYLLLLKILNILDIAVHCTAITAMSKSVP